MSFPNKISAEIIKITIFRLIIRFPAIKLMAKAPEVTKIII